MKGQTVARKQTLRQSAAERARVLPMLQDYLARTGLGVRDFARRINYAYQTLNLFMNDEYHKVAGTHLLVCRAIEEYISANPIEPPEEVFGQLYETENSRVIRQTMQELLKQPFAYILYGPPGFQKSFTLRHEVNRLRREEASKNGHGRRAYYLHAKSTQRERPGITPMQLMKEVAIACGTSSIGDIPHIMRNLAFDFRGRRVLLVIDEAQRLDIPCLEMLRDLLDEPPHFSLLLAGSHELMKKFDMHAPVLEQWNSRVAAKVMLPGLTEQEAYQIARAEEPGISDKRAHVAISEATRMDAFNENRQYINIRTLTMTLRRTKVRPEVVSA